MYSLFQEQSWKKFKRTIRKRGYTVTKPICKLIGQNGNIFNLMGITTRVLKEHNLSEQAEEMKNRIMGGEADSYDKALQIIMEYVEIE